MNSIEAIDVALRVLGRRSRQLAARVGTPAWLECEEAITTLIDLRDHIAGLDPVAQEGIR